MNMRHKRIVAAILVMCLCALPQMASFAVVTIVGNDTNGIGPGFDNTSNNEINIEDNTNTGKNEMAWKKVDGAYMDESGNVIEGALLRGISVSKWQGQIDWKKVAADDVAFAWIRMGSFGYEGEYTMDETFDRNMREARANGIDAAPYVYLQTRTVEEAKEAARYAVETARQYEVTYPLAVDIESQSILDLPVPELTDIVNAFCQVIAESGYTPIVYSDYSKFTANMDTNQIPYDIWLARYGGDHTYANRTIWQSTDKGRVAGIDGNVCLEFAFKDYTGRLQKPDSSEPNTDFGRDVQGPGAEGIWGQEDGSWYYYVNGQRVTGWIQPDGSWYYLDPANGGAMVFNTTMEIEGTTYSFDGSGAML